MEDARSAGAAGPLPDAAEYEHCSRVEGMPFDIDVWYDALKEHTFPTRFLSLCCDESLAIVHYYQARWNRRQGVLTSADVKRIRKVERRVDVELKAHFQPDGAMIRLTTRSPKDGYALGRAELQQCYEAECERIMIARFHATLKPSERLLALNRVPLLRVRTGPEAVELLLSSERCFVDCMDSARYGLPIAIALRQWDPRVSVDLEFRAFVWGDRLTAMTQYDHYATYPLLQSAAVRDQLVELVEAEWRTVHPLIPGASGGYVADFAYIPQEHVSSDAFCSDGSLPPGRIMLVELSPFVRSTGPALFDWDIDRKVLEGLKPFEFRVRTGDELVGIDDLVEVCVFERLYAVVRPYFELLLDAEKRLEQERQGANAARPWDVLWKLQIALRTCAIL